MSHKFFSIFAAALVLLLAVFFTSCEKEDPNGISKTNVKATDFLNLYGKSANDVDAALVNFIIDKDNYNTDANPYWIITTKKNSLSLIIDGDEVFTTVTFKNNVCIDVSLLYNGVVSNGTTLANLKAAYGEGTKMGDNWFDWILIDNSRVSYFGTKLSSGRKSLLVYRKSASSADAPQKTMENARKNVGLE